MKKLEKIHFILNNKYISAENLFDDEYLLRNFSYRIYNDSIYSLIGYSHLNRGGYYEYINLNFDFLLHTNEDIIDTIFYHISRYVKK